MATVFSEMRASAEKTLSYEDFIRTCPKSALTLVPEKAERIVKRAEENLTEVIPILPASLFLEFYKDGTRVNYEQLCTKRRAMLLNLVIAESYERQGRFTDKLIDVLWATLEESTWIYPAHLSNYPTHNEFGLPAAFGDRLHGIDIFSAPTAAVLALAYHLLRDELDATSPVICEKLLYELNARITVPFLNCRFWWAGDNGKAPNNWCPWSISNVLFVTAFTERDTYKRRRIVDRALRALDKFTAGYAPDGGCDEGPGYWGGAGASYFDCIELIYEMTGGGIDVFDHPLIRPMCEYVVKFNINGKKRFVNFADCAPSCHHDGTMIQRMGKRCSSPTLISFGAAMAAIDDVKMPWTHVWRAICNLTTPTPAPESPKADRRIWFPDLKVMIARESEDPEKGLFVAMKGGNNAESHNHNDVGSFVVYYNGNPVIIDTGAGKYKKQTFSSRRYELWYMQSQYHNLPTFDGIGEKEGARYASCDEVYDVESGGVKMQIKNAYLPEAGIASYTRECVLAGGEVRVTDEIELDCEREIDFRFITHVCPTVEDGSIMLAEGRAMSYSATLVPRIEAFDVDDIGVEGNWKTKQLYIIHLTARASGGKFTFSIK